MTSEPTTSMTTTPAVDGDELGAVADRLVAQSRTDGIALTGPGGLLGGLTKKVLETALAAELTEHLGYEAGDPRPGSNARRPQAAARLIVEVGDVTGFPTAAHVASVDLHRAGRRLLRRPGPPPAVAGREPADQRRPARHGHRPTQESVCSPPPRRSGHRNQPGSATLSR